MVMRLLSSASELGNPRARLTFRSGNTVPVVFVTSCFVRHLGSGLQVENYESPVERP